MMCTPAHTWCMSRNSMCVLLVYKLCAVQGDEEVMREMVANSPNVLPFCVDTNERRWIHWLQENFDRHTLMKRLVCVSHGPHLPSFVMPSTLYKFWAVDTICPQMHVASGKVIATLNSPVSSWISYQGLRAWGLEDEEKPILAFFGMPLPGFQNIRSKTAMHLVIAQQEYPAAKY